MLDRYILRALLLAITRRRALACTLNGACRLDFLSPLFPSSFLSFLFGHGESSRFIGKLARKKERIARHWRKIFRWKSNKGGGLHKRTTRGASVGAGRNIRSYYMSELQGKYFAERRAHFCFASGLGIKCRRVDGIRM